MYYIYLSYYSTLYTEKVKDCYEMYQEPNFFISGTCNVPISHNLTNFSNLWRIMTHSKEVDSHFDFE
jgi:hypothetical protein